LNDILPVGSKPAGAGAYGQLDLAGSMTEWTLDYFASDYPAACDNCANLVPSSNRVVRGGSWFDVQSLLITTFRNMVEPQYGVADVGFRCARNAR
jgi:formylglycine-generating enzyme